MVMNRASRRNATQRQTPAPPPPRDHGRRTVIHTNGSDPELEQEEVEDEENDAATETNNFNNDETTLFLLRKISVTHHHPCTSLEMEKTADIIHYNNEQQQQQRGGTASQWAVAVNLAKCICGAGSFALPHVFREQGVLGGLISMTVCGMLAIFTMQQLMRARLRILLLSSSSSATLSSSSSSQCCVGDGRGGTSSMGDGGSSYVQLARAVLGNRAAHGVFALTLAASLGVCSTYLVFIGQTLESLSTTTEAQGDNNNGVVPTTPPANNQPVTTITNNFVQQVFPNVSCTTWEVTIVLFLLYPLSCISDYSIFAFTSALGVLSVLGGILVTLAYGLWVDPGWERAVDGLHNLPLWPESWTAAFGGSFGTIAYLFCINFLTFPIMNSMREPEHYGSAVRQAVWGVWLVNVVFAVLCVGFYGDNTQDLVLANLNNGPYLAALKLLLCIDLLFTFPIVFSSGRQIVEHAWLTFRATAVAGKHDDNDYSNCPDPLEVTMPERVVLVAVAVMLCLGLAQIGGFGAVANLVGGVAQGTLAFVLPPAIILKLARKRMLVLQRHQILAQWLVGAFGVIAVTAVTYSTVRSMLRSR